MKSDIYRSNGKLLLTGEYLVLDGAKALALPTKYGQSLSVTPNDLKTLNWKSFDENNELWFEAEFSIEELKKGLIQTSDAVTDRLIQILNAAITLNSNFLKSGVNVVTTQDFNRLWGLGTSSTLINNIANWANVDAYELLVKTFGGSGYDIACAQHKAPLTFQLNKEQQPEVALVDFDPSFKAHLYFVYLNQKQNSREGISNYKKNKNTNRIEELFAVSDISNAIISTSSLDVFEIYMKVHENIISKCIDQEPIQSKLFKDFEGVVKSLGAWGGDFVLVTSKTDPTSYFKAKGFEVIIPYKDMILEK